jgi:hypothetical protein
MALDREDVKLLTYPFPAKAHKFVTDMPYLHEEAINDRLDLVDPSWGFKLNHVERRANAGEGGKDVGTIWAHVTMTVKGVSRDAIGMAVIQQTNPQEIKKWNNGKSEGTGEFYTSEANEAEKSATTDALKRAARMFGIGRYLLAIPKQNSKSTVTNTQQMEAWLKASFGEIKDLVAFEYEDESPAPSIEIDDYLPTNVTDMPAAKPWTEAEIKEFWAHYNGTKKLVTGTIQAALGVKKMGDWKGSLAEANAAMETYIKKIS